MSTELSNFVAGQPAEQAAVQAVRELLPSVPLPILVERLKNHNNPTLQFEAARALTEISAGTSDQAKQVVDAGAVPLFIQLLHSPDASVRQEVVCALANIIDNGPILQDPVIMHGGVQPLLSLIKPDTPIWFLGSILCVISSLCRNRGPPQLPAATIHEILAALNVLIDHTDPNILVAVIYVIFDLTDTEDEQIQKMVIESGLVPKLIALLGSSEVDVLTAALKVVSNIAVGSDEQTQVVLSHGALSYFPVLISHAEEDIRREAVVVLVHITAGQSQVKAVFDMGLVPKIIENLRKGDFVTQHAAAWLIRDFAIHGSRQQVFAMISEVVPPFCHLLSCQDTDVIEVVLGGLYAMLVMAGAHSEMVAIFIEGCEGLAKIKLLQSHANVAICELANRIIDNYFRH